MESKPRKLKNHFWCIEASGECPKDLVGNLNCEGCKSYQKCDCCGKYKSTLCKDCEVNYELAKHLLKRYVKLGYTVDDVADMISNYEEVDWM